jgi:hypothetical protein
VIVILGIVQQRTGIPARNTAAQGRESPTVGCRCLGLLTPLGLLAEGAARS